ncbi:MAG: cyclase [Pseudarthrobacter sp.]|nr:cyclase [Pseudarthrobacter sp.]
MAGPAFRRPAEDDQPDHRAGLPTTFTDEQVKGPFTFFRHVHEFEATATGSIMTDRVEFTAPFGPVGRLVEKFILRGYLQRLIEDRGKFLASETSQTGAH